MSALIWLIPVLGVIGLLVALGLAMFVKKQDEGNDRMKEIAAAIHEGARAFLSAEYEVSVSSLPFRRTTPDRVHRS